MAITAAMVKELREATQAGMMECKKALTECDGDMKKAMEYLQIKGLAKAAKRGARKTSEGVIGIYRTDDGKGVALVEVNCETDFVARTDNFKNFCNTLARDIYDANPASDANLLELACNGETVEVRRANLSASTGENIRVGRFCRVTVEKGAVVAYRHHDLKGAVCITLSCDNDATASNDAFKDFASELILHIYSANPLAISSDEIDPALVADQKKVFIQKAAESGKPEAMLERIAVGMLNKWFAEAALLKQIWQCDDSKELVEQKLAKCEKAAGGKISLSNMTRIVIGEGAVQEEEEAAE